MAISTPVDALIEDVSVWGLVTSEVKLLDRPLVDVSATLISVGRLAARAKGTAATGAWSGR